VIVSQVGISGSTKIGPYVVIAGQAGIAGHLNIGAGAKIGGKSGVISDISAGDEVVGYPPLPKKDFFKQAVVLKQLVKQRGKKHD